MRNFDLVATRYGKTVSELLGFKLGDPIGYIIDEFCAIAAHNNGWDAPTRVIVVKQQGS